MILLRKIFSFATLTLLVALTLSSIAAWYSIQGLMAIFAAAVIPIMIMGGSLELAKVVTTVWLHRYWDRCGWKLKIYLVPSVVALALLTSMGIFGFLSKAHIDQGLPTGDVAAQVALIDEKISNERQNIDAARSLLKQLDDAVLGITVSKDRDIKQRDGSTYSQSGAERAVQIRRSQAKDRADLTKQIEQAQARIVKLQEEKAPIASQLRKVEAEVGPIKYVAALIYGDNPDTNLLERAVRWMIILIVLVFDPLALTLVLAAQSSYKWLDEDLKKRKEEDNFAEKLLAQKGAVDPATDLEEPAHDKCGTPECCGECDTAVDSEFMERLNTIKPVPAPKENNNVEVVQQSDVEPDAVVGNDELETHLPVADEHVENLEHNEETVEGHPGGETRQAESEPLIRTEGVTLHEIHEGYYDYEGKSMSKAALLGMHPELFSAKPDSEQSNTNFGTEFPRFAKKGDIFVRVDALPNKVFKFDGNRWIEINKESSDSYLYDEAYIRHLVSKIESGEYDVELLSENEKAQIEEYLQRSQQQDK